MNEAVQKALQDVQFGLRATLEGVTETFEALRASGNERCETARCVAIAKAHLETALLWVLAGTPHPVEPASKIQLS